MKQNMKMIISLILGIIVVGSIAPIVAGHTSNHGEVIVLDNGVQVEFKATGFVPWNDNAKNQMTSTITIDNVLYEVTYHTTGSGNKATSMVAIPNEVTTTNNTTSINSWNYTDIEINDIPNVNETNQTKMNDTNITNQTIMNDTIEPMTNITMNDTNITNPTIMNDTIVVNDTNATTINDTNDTMVNNTNGSIMNDTNMNTQTMNNDIEMLVAGNPYVLLIVAIMVVLVGVAVSRKL